MKIKNTKLLRARANAHAKYDRIKQGTYGRASVNGHATFEGCAIGCLTTPHTKKGLRNFLQGIFGGSGNGFLEDVGWDDEDQRTALRKEFGICRTLAVALESLFESQPTHGAAIEFIPAFAAALVEDSNIQPKEVHEKFPECFAFDMWDDSEEFTQVDRAIVGDVTDKFLAFLRSKKATA